MRSVQQQLQHFRQHQQQRNRNRHNEFEFDAFKFWKHMNNSRALHQDGPGVDSRFEGMGRSNSEFRKVAWSRYYSVTGLN